MKRISIYALCTITVFAIGLTVYFGLAQAQPKHISHNSRGDNEGRATNAAVSFGGWMTSPPLNRFPNVNPIPANHHTITPNEIKIKTGGTVSFIIGGFHNVLVYGDGTRPEDINVNLTVPPTNGGPPLINDPNNRIYRGLDPSLQSQDRVEVVQFAQPGDYLVICGVRPHFVNDRMYAFVKVRGGGDD